MPSLCDASTTANDNNRQRLDLAEAKRCLDQAATSDLHGRAGSGRVIHMHGELLKARCVACHAITEWRKDLGNEASCTACHEPGTMRPHVVWFGEMPLHMEAIEAALATSDLFVAIGTSGSVYPAAGFVTQARDQGVRTCELNLEPSDNASMFDMRRYGPASTTVKAWVDEILAC